MPVCTGIYRRTMRVNWAKVLIFSVSFFVNMSASPNMTASRADSDSVRKTAFLGFSPHKWMVSVLGFQLYIFSTVSHPPGSGRENGGLLGCLM